MHSPTTSPLHVPLAVHDSLYQEREHEYELDHHSSEGDNAARKDKIKIFPVFSDLELSTFSINYSLYLQFFHSTLRILARLLVLVVFVNIIDIIVMGSIIQDYNVSASNNSTLTEFCPANDPDPCYNLMIGVSPFLTEYMQHSVRTSYAVATSVLVLIFLVCMRKREEDKVINNPLLYQFNWTQDLFSLIIEKIPRNVTQQEELKTYLEDLEPVKKCNGSVKGIIWVPDYYRAVELHEKIEKMEKMPLPKEEADQQKHEATLKELKDALVKEKAALPVHSGKAIVVFNNIETKTLVRKVLTPSMWNILKSLWRGSDKEVTLESAFLGAKELPEPEDLMFENLCYPRQKKLLRQFAVYLAGLILIAAASAGGLLLDLRGDFSEIMEQQEEIENGIQQIIAKLTGTTESDNEDSSDSDYELGFIAQRGISLMILLVESITDMIFRQLNKFTRHKSESELDVNCFYYSIYSSFIFYLFIQGVIMTLGITGLESLVQTTTMFLCSRYVVRKIANTYLLYKNTKAHAHTHDHEDVSIHDQHQNKTIISQMIYEIGYRILCLSLNIFVQIDLETSEFEFFEEAAKAFPLLALNFAFTANGSVSIPTILPSTDSRSIIPIPMMLTLLVLYIGAVCDKYRMMIQHEDCKLTSARFMLKLYNFYRCDHAAAFLGGFVWFFCFISLAATILVSFQEAGGDNTGIAINITEYLTTYGPSQFYSLMLIVLAAYIFYLFVWPCQPSLETQFGKRFFNHKSNIDYDKVCSEFTSKYHPPKLGGHEEERIERTESAIL